jgi:hypothetical protein
MNALHDKTVDDSIFSSQSAVSVAAQRHPTSTFAVPTRRSMGQTPARSENWCRRSEKWGDLMIAAQDGQSEAYEQLLRELDAWLRRYYARRLPRAAAEDARQHVLLPFMPNGTRTRRRNPSDGIARYKWIDHIRDRMNVLKEITTDDRQDRH